MKRTARNSTLIAVALAMTLFLAKSSTAWAANDVSSADLQAVARAIGFLNGTPNDGTVVVGIVYADTVDGRAKANQIAALLGSLPGPNKTKFRAILVAAKDLAQAPGRLDAVILMPNQLVPSNEIAEAVRRRHVVSVSTDASCLDAKCCVLMVQTVGRVRIVIDTALADAVGARFSTVFMMIVERK